MDIKVLYKKRKTLCLKVELDGSVTLLAPVGMPQKLISEFVSKHSGWIESRQQSVLQRQSLWDSVDSQTITLWKEKALEYIPQRVRYYSEIMGVCPQGIKITNAKTRFGSCSAKNSLCFSVYLMYYPECAIDCVIVHELAHIKQKNHSQKFYDEVKRVMPDYDGRKKLLKNGIL